MSDILIHVYIQQNVSSNSSNAEYGYFTHLTAGDTTTGSLVVDSGAITVTNGALTTTSTPSAASGVPTSVAFSSTLTAPGTSSSAAFYTLNVLATNAVQDTSSIVAGIAGGTTTTCAALTNTFIMAGMFGYNAPACNFTTLTRVYAYRAAPLLVSGSVFGTVNLLVGYHADGPVTSSITVSQYAAFYARTTTAGALSWSYYTEGAQSTGTNGAYVIGGASSAGTINAGFWGRSNVASCAVGLVGGTAADTCMYRASARLWTYNPGTSLQLDGNGVANVFISAVNGNLRLGSSVGTAKATTDTTGWPMMPSVAGTPTGVPQNETSNSAAFTWDRTNKKLCIRDTATLAWICMTTPMEIHALEDRIVELEKRMSRISNALDVLSFFKIY